MLPSNDHSDLQPRTDFHGPTDRLDFPGLKIGVAEYEEGPTGCTVFLFERGWLTALDIRGGLWGTSGDYDLNRGICFAGGSVLGIEATAGVAAELFAQGGYALQHLPLMSGAIIFDSGSRNNAIYPDRELGSAAARAARPGRFPLSRHGAGRSATVGNLLPGGSEPGGQGAAFREMDGVKLMVCVVVNALGAVVGRSGRVVRGNVDPASGERVRPTDPRMSATPGRAAEPRPAQNTTLTLVATNARLDTRPLRQLGNQVHASMARAIQPFHTLSGGDALYCVTSNLADSTFPSDMLA